MRKTLIVTGDGHVGKVRQYLSSEDLKHRIQQKGPSIRSVIKMVTELGDGVKYLTAKLNNHKADLMFSHRSFCQSFFHDSIFDEITTGFLIVIFLSF